MGQDGTPQEAPNVMCDFTALLEMFDSNESGLPLKPPIYETGEGYRGPGEWYHEEKEASTCRVWDALPYHIKKKN